MANIKLSGLHKQTVLTSRRKNNPIGLSAVTRPFALSRLKLQLLAQRFFDRCDNVHIVGWHVA